MDHGFLAAAGPVTAEQRTLFWTVAAILVFVAGPVLILTPIIAWHYRRSNTHDAFRPDWTFSWTLEGFIWIPPILIVGILAVLLFGATHRLDPYRPVAGGRPLEVQVIATDWKWLFIYPDAGVTSVNRLVVPIGRPVSLTLTSATVMQSLMIPRLTGQIYMMAGMTTRLNLRADRAGDYRGRNMQYNGSGFPEQSFVVTAVTADRFRGWLAANARSAPALGASAQTLLAERATVGTARTYSRVPSNLFATVIANSGGRDHAHRAVR